MPANQLLIRFERLRVALRETRSARGRAAAVALLGRIVLRKGPVLLRRIRASRGTGALRAKVAKGRGDLATGEPYLAFVLTGGLGDYVVIARFIRDLSAHVGDIKFDIFSPSPTAAAWAFANVRGFHGAYYDILFENVVAEYDVGMRLNQFAVVYRENIQWRSIQDQHGLMKVITNLVAYRPKVDVFVERHPLLDNFLAQAAVFANATRRDFLHVMAGVPYRGERLPLPQDPGVVSRLGLRPRQYVTVHNGFDTEFVITGRRATKCYPHFGAVVAELKAAYPELRFVQVGTVTSEPIAECDLTLLNKTSLDEVVGLLAQAVLHIDNEGGLVHVAACVGTRSTVVFGPTPSDYFGYPGNVNIDPPVCGSCWWMTRTWMDVCAKGYDTPRCLMEQPPAVVAKHALRAIAEAIAAPGEGTPASGVMSVSRLKGGIPTDLDRITPAVPAPPLADVLERAINIERKIDGVTGQLEGRRFDGHPDQAFGGTTYAQFGEDLIILNLFHMLGVAHPTYLDVGAHHPFNICNTALLHIRGSRGINVDANPHLIEAFREHRSEDININVGVGPERGELDFHFIDDWSGRNTFKRELAEEFVHEHPDFRIQKVQKVPVVTLNDIVAEHASGRFPDFLSLDVEGMDYEILRSASFDEARPTVICVEADIDTQVDQGARLVELLNGRGYSVYTRTAGNLIFVQALAMEKLRGAAVAA
jgi:FkbM family methyltransferase